MLRRMIDVWFKLIGQGPMGILMLSFLMILMTTGGILLIGNGLL
ncbi:hypothetical protein Q0O65_14160 [Bacillus paranthracis]|nr:hypothetical protein [Bacillus paranthracis]MDN8637848.1 hypothetical protein [Bacillus paranthracis]